jgi:hypothetical protein
MALNRIRTTSRRPEDTRFLDAWGRQWCDRQGYTEAPSDVAGVVARTLALDNRKQAVDEMHELCKPYRHPSRVPEKKSEPIVEPPPAVRKRGAPKGKTLKLRLPEEELSAWKSLAERHGRSLSDLVRTSVRDELEFDRADPRTELDQALDQWPARL